MFAIAAPPSVQASTSGSRVYESCSSCIDFREKGKNIVLLSFNSSLTNTETDRRFAVNQDSGTASVYNRMMTLRNLGNRIMAEEEAKRAFGLELRKDGSALSSLVVLITNALRNLPIEKMRFAEFGNDSVNFYFSFGEKRVLQLTSALPRVTDGNVLVTLYSNGECVYMDEMSLKVLVRDFEKYLC